MAFDVQTLIEQGIFPDTPQFRALGDAQGRNPAALPPPSVSDILAQSGETFNGLSDVLTQIQRNAEVAAEGTAQQVRQGVAAGQAARAQAAARAAPGLPIDVNLLAKGMEQLIKLGTTQNFSPAALIGPLLNFPGGSELAGLMDKATSAMLSPEGVDFGKLLGGDYNSAIGANMLDSLQNGLMGQLMGQLPPSVQAMVQAAQQIAGALGLSIPPLGDLLRKKHTPPPPVGPGCHVDRMHIAVLMNQVAHTTPNGLFPGPGAPTVFWNWLPVWRITSDLHVCPLLSPLPHVPPTGAPVMKGSETTKACGLAVARVGDFVVEPTGGPNPILGGLVPRAPRTMEKAKKLLQNKPFNPKEGIMGQHFDQEDGENGGKYCVLPNGDRAPTDKTLGDYLDPNNPKSNRAIVYPNGMNYKEGEFQDALDAAKALASRTGRPVILVYNKAPDNISLNPLAYIPKLFINNINAADISSAAGNYFGIGDKEPTQQVLEDILRGTRGSVSFEPHSEGNLLLINALQAVRNDVDISKPRITADASPTGWYPPETKVIRNEDPGDPVSNSLKGLLPNYGGHPLNVVNQGPDLIDPNNPKGPRIPNDEPRPQHNPIQYFKSPDRKGADDVDEFGPPDGIDNGLDSD